MPAVRELIFGYVTPGPVLQLVVTDTLIFASFGVVVSFTAFVEVDVGGSGVADAGSVVGVSVSIGISVAVDVVVLSMVFVGVFEGVYVGGGSFVGVKVDLV